ncbi:hypothetical protein BDU57DRAFT_263374 [Ampelomyces quisqualis]|uniref:Uncharacterized protein n=1 Tax=Ampelomyces quisqualis TaxID=50730 RepID=A0A6A5QHZ3_AMPQU|nr:hypothetical protein BDU57DRAFT_263374 [Ampelomyces quisqualis]
MTPTPVKDDSNLLADPTSTPKPDDGYWTKANIGVTATSAVLTLTVFVVLLVFWIRRRSQKKKRINRKSDKAALLQDEDKGSMFSRGPHSSVTLYVDEEANMRSKRPIQDTIFLVPLQITPAEETRDPIETTSTTASNGSGVSVMSRLSSNTASTLMLSPIPPNDEDGDLSIRPSGRARIMSRTSQKARYYDTTPVDVDRGPIPTIIQTSSD